MYMKLKDGKSKVLTLSYDDAVVQDIRLINIMDRHGIKGTFNINTGYYLAEDAVREKYYGRMKLSEAQQLYTNSVHEIAVHGLSHPFFDGLKTEHALVELLEDRKNIEAQYGRLARGMAYPFGTYTDTVMDCLKLSGICYSRTTQSTEKFAFPKEWLCWHPTCHHKNPDLMKLAQTFRDTAPRHLAQNWLFYVWGHSYEFDDKDNWDVIENFCEYIGGREDIWYATNIEIYDYVQAYERLQVSVDGTIVHNPSAVDVWFTQHDNVYCVRGGETVNVK